MNYELHVIAMNFSLYDIPKSREHMIVYHSHTAFKTGGSLPQAPIYK
jgi:hypothetical protein